MDGLPGRESIKRTELRKIKHREDGCESRFTAIQPFSNFTEARVVWGVIETGHGFLCLLPTFPPGA